MLGAGGSAVKSQNILFDPDVVDGTNDVASYPWEHVAVINATTPLTVTLSAKPATGNQATDLRVRTARLVAVRINAATDPTIVP